MTKDEATARSAMKLALDALVEMNPSGPTGSPIWHQQMEAITALREALAQERSSDEQPSPVAEPRKQEPVAWMTKDGEIYKHECWPEYEARPLVFGDTFPPTLSLAQRIVLPDAINDDSESPEYRNGWNECREVMRGMMK